MEKTLGVNEQCFIRSQSCGRVFGGSRTCFIACPSSEQLQLEIDVIKAVLRDSNIEPYVAIDNFEPAKDIFCEKICAKIIESQFCTVLLSDISYPGQETATPNPNVYYEYGLMVASHKTIIPLQRQGAPLAFNIQSLDTLTYNPKSLRGVFQAVLKGVLGKSGSVGNIQKHNCLSLYKRLSELENKRFIPPTSLPESWKSIISDTVFEVRQDPAFVADFTNAWTINTVLSEIKILLNHIANEISSLQDQISKSETIVPSTNAPITLVQPAYQYPQQFLWYSSYKSKAELETDLSSIKEANILAIVPNKWINEITEKYVLIEHTHKPQLNVLKEEDIIGKAVETGLMPKVITS